MPISSCESPEPLPEFHRGPRRRGPERLVKQQDLRPDGERRPRATRCRWPPESCAGLRPPSPSSRGASRRSSSTRAVDLRLRHLPHPQPEGDVFKHAHVAEEGVVLEHEAHLPLPGMPMSVMSVAILDDHALLRVFEAGDDPQERGLARARGRRGAAAACHQARRAKRRRGPRNEPNDFTMLRT